MTLLVQNVRLLLYRHGWGDGAYPELLARLVGVEVDLAARFLSGQSDLPGGAVQQLADWAGRSVADLRAKDLLAEETPRWIFHQNVRYLIRTDSRFQKEIAEVLGSDESTVSNWLRGRQGPPLTKMRSIGAAFGVPDPGSLAEAPYFLTEEPVSADQRRAWLRLRVGSAPDEVIAGHFLSLRKLLGGS